jgi:hypothetical protein
MASKTFLSVIPFSCNTLTNWLRSPWCLAVSFKLYVFYFGKNNKEIGIPNALFLNFKKGKNCINSLTD